MNSAATWISQALDYCTKPWVRATMGVVINYPTMEPQELAALAECREGKLTAFGLIYDTYVERVYRFLYYKAFHREVAEDLTSQTFMKALEHVAEYDSTKGELTSWLYRIAQNTFIDHYRRERPMEDVDEQWGLASSDNIFETTAQRETFARVEQYLAKLPAEERELIVLRVWQGLSYQEISELTGKSEAALKMASSRALRKLRAALPLAVYLLLFSQFHL